MKETPWAVWCYAERKTVCLTEEEYGRQIMRANSLWSCPDCGGKADWDDEHYEKHMELKEQEWSKEL